jgi:antitoxin component YwqK of YwqJK toxin-antitoxin module
MIVLGLAIKPLERGIVVRKSILVFALLVLAQPHQALDLEKVKELKKLGFTNEQIASMMQKDKEQKMKPVCFQWNPNLKLYSTFSFTGVDQAGFDKAKKLWFNTRTGALVTGRVEGLSVMVELKNGKPHGCVEFYFPNEKLRSEGTFKDGKWHGLHKTYNENGQLKSEGTYKDGEWDGLVKHYYENGQMFTERNYKDGKKHGLHKFYDTNGELYSETTFKDGKVVRP